MTDRGASDRPQDCPAADDPEGRGFSAAEVEQCQVQTDRLVSRTAQGCMPETP